MQLLAPLPKAGHNPADAMRLLVTLIILIFSSSTQAQYPWAYPQIRPYNPPYGGPYAPHVQGRAPLSQAMLDAHNVVRARVGVAPLAWSAELAGVAQDWASRLIATGGFGHRPNSQYGENVYAISGGIASQPRWSATGPRRRADTMFAAMPARESAATTHKSSGARHALSVAQSPPVRNERSGFATMIHQGTSSATVPTND